MTFPDVYGANTGGWSWEEALEMAEDCLGVALSIYVKKARGHSRPKPPAGRPGVDTCPAYRSRQLTLYTAMREQGLTNVALAARLGLSEGAVRRLVNPLHRSHISQRIEKALKAVGRSLVVEDRPAQHLSRPCRSQRSPGIASSDIFGSFEAAASYRTNTKVSASKSTVAVFHPAAHQERA